VVEMRGGKKVVTPKRFFPGYILVEMHMSDNAWHVVKNTPKVTGFVGRRHEADAAQPRGGGPDPPAGDDGRREAEAEVQFEKGDQVRINEGPFASFNGVVDEVNPTRTR
jgi:transcription termination/antitermination protein NusG